MDYDTFINDILISRGRYIDYKYKETHHIIPKCMKGTNDENNLIELTLEEHFIAHKLLVEKYPDNFKLKYALNMMAESRNGLIISKEDYSFSKKEFRKTFKSIERNKKISKSLTGKKMPEEIKKKISTSNEGKNKGKHYYNNGVINKLCYTCPIGFTKGRLPTSEDVKKKISNTLKGHKVSEESKLKMKQNHNSKGMTGKHHSEKTKKLLSMKHKNFHHTNESKRKISNTLKSTLKKKKEGKINE